MFRPNTLHSGDQSSLNLRSRVRSGDDGLTFSRFQAIRYCGSTWTLAKNIEALLLLVCLVVPLAAQKVRIDYSKNTDFSRFKTYAWVPGTPVFDPELDRYIKSSVIDVLRHSGMTEATVGTADLLVTYHAATKTDLSVGTAIDPTYTASGGVAVPGQSVWESSGGSATHVTKGSLTFEILDRAANRAIWTGTAKHTLSDKTSERWDQVQKALDKVFRHFPPTTKSTS